MTDFPTHTAARRRVNAPGPARSPKEGSDMTHRTHLLLTASLAAALAAPGLASAHSSVISCPATPGGPFIASDDPGYGVPTITVNADGTLRLRWPDGYSRTVAAPAGCTPVAPPEPPPVVPVAPPPAQVSIPAPPPVLPPVIATPPVKEGGVKQPTRGRLISSTSYRVVRAVSCKRAGGRAYSVVRIRVVWKREGRVVKIKTAIVRRPGQPCVAPAVTG